MTHKDYEIAQKLKARLSEITRIIDFKIFGSKARGDADEYSDMDVFIEVEDINENLKDKIYDIVWEIGFENFIFISPLILTRYEIEESPLRSSQIVKNINEEGIKI